ncbi:Hypothetical predicted protein [Pelobates cultripes]|uniref:Uncharacterized protein n=1 Tax=Pelobates cultripes TaxID=61616 RepID=A0AAD1WT92_PELCU|nr:Hypothetical predicted protein [Pelobates cultripes]
MSASWWRDTTVTTENLVELQKEAIDEQISFEEEEISEKQLSSMKLEEACQMWVNLQTFLQQHHPDKALAQRLVNSFDTDMSPFRGMLKRHQGKQTMEWFLQKPPRHEEEPACVSDAQLPYTSSSSN